MLYRQVELKEGELVQFVGVYVTRWQREWGEPTVGFVQVDEAEEATQAAIASEANRKCKYDGECSWRYQSGDCSLDRCLTDWRGGLSRPPLGLMPKDIHVQKRAIEIIKAVHRYVEAYHPIPQEWLQELSNLYGSTTKAESKLPSKLPESEGGSSDEEPMAGTP